MADVGDRIAVRSKGSPRSGVVTAVSGAQIHGAMGRGGETSLIPGPGVLTLVQKAASAKKAAPVKKSVANKKLMAKNKSPKSPHQIDPLARRRGQVASQAIEHRARTTEEQSQLVDPCARREKSDGDLEQSLAVPRSLTRERSSVGTLGFQSGNRNKHPVWVLLTVRAGFPFVESRTPRDVRTRSG